MQKIKSSFVILCLLFWLPTILSYKNPSVKYKQCNKLGHGRMSWLLVQQIPDKFYNTKHQQQKLTR